MQRKSIFDAVRRLLGRGFRQGEVNSLDAAIDAAMREAGEQLAKEAGGHLGVSKAGIDLIKRFEGLARLIPGDKVAAYADPVGIPTIAWGATRIDGRPVRLTDVITLERAEELLREDIERHARMVREYLGSAPTTQGQFDALTSFTFNLGGGALGKSTLGRLHKLGDYGSAAQEFARWVYAGSGAGKRKLNGLVRRRKAERELYES